MDNQEKVKNYWMSKRVFVTGATGFLGSWITKYLVDYGAQVTILLRDEVPLSNFHFLGLKEHVNTIRGELENYDLLLRSLQEHDIDTCIHVAAQAIVGNALKNPRQTFESNIRGTWNVLEATRNADTIKRVVIASSDKAYGTQEELPYREDASLIGRYPYDVSKSCADLLGKAYHSTYGLPIGITRCGNLYGPGDTNFSRIVPGTFYSIINDENPIIRSDGTFMRDYFFVKDAAEAYLLLARSLDRHEIRGQAFNFAPQRPLTVIELFEKMIAVSGKTHLKPIIKNEAKAEIRNQYLSSEKAKNLLGWKAKHAVEDALKETYEWYLEFVNKYLKKNSST